MSSNSPAPPPASDASATPTLSFPASPFALPWWKKFCLVGAAVLVAGGLALRPFEGSGEAPPAGEPGARIEKNPSISPSALVDEGEHGLVPEGTRVEIPPDWSPQGSPESPGAPSWSPALMKGGLSFLVGFCLGFLFRTFLKLTALVLGLNLAIYFGLSHLGVLEIHWDVLNGYFDSFISSFQDDFSELRNFLTGSLPSAGLAALGLFVGYKKS